MSDNLAVAQEILRQLGGKRFILFTGVKNLLGDAYSLQMQFRQNKHDYFSLKITLTPMDEYKLEFHKRKSLTEFELVKTIDNVYCENLVEIFERETELYTKL